MVEAHTPKKMYTPSMAEDEVERIYRQTYGLPPED